MYDKRHEIIVKVSQINRYDVTIMITVPIVIMSNDVCQCHGSNSISEKLLLTLHIIHIQSSCKLDGEMITVPVTTFCQREACGASQPPLHQGSGSVT